MEAGSIPQPPCQWRWFGIEVARVASGEVVFAPLVRINPFVGALTAAMHRIEVSGCHDGKAATS
jgi:hypothetical protein